MKQSPFSALIFLLSAFSCFSQATHKSIHQEQSENYSKYNYTSEKKWDALRIQENGVSPMKKVNPSSQTCTLKKRVFGWEPYWSGTAYTNYQWNLLSDMSFFSYEVNATTGDRSEERRVGKECRS